MERDRKGAEILVGLFLLLGFAVLAVMVVMFGRMGGGATGFYRLTVEFPNASGIFKGADVLLAGAKIGQVVEGPRLVVGTYRVELDLSIRSDVRIPRQVKFVVGSSGLLGDRYVDAQLQPGFTAQETLAAGEHVQGSFAGGGMDELTEKGGIVLDRLTEELKHIQVLTLRLTEGVLNERNLKNLEETFANLQTVSARFKETAGALDAVVVKAGTTVGSADTLMRTANRAAEDLRGTIGDARVMIASTADTVQAATALVKKAAEGDGAVARLINDKGMAEDLRNLVSNLKRFGVLWYRDRPVPETAPAATPTPIRRRERR